ncbi:hypothetical protein M0811_10861 [Anaeramoeba ignava]|uniref:Fibronectin type-III domain-containing protein n=1 Tax=Anaeramoeba ignava TaxID=1746090 RepID=A0A9Q0LCZ0_ANAIG|nr:hypothetical protein M0811_10861 [Anaeramoeba ignava]
MKSILSIFLIFNIILFESIQNSEISNLLISKYSSSSSSPYSSSDGIYTWNLKQTLSKDSGSFGTLVAIYKNIMVISAPGNNRVYVYRYDGTNWNLDDILSDSAVNFGYSIAVYEDYIVVGAYGDQKVFAYKYNGQIWSLSYTLSESVSNYGKSVAIYGYWLLVGAPDQGQVFVYCISCGFSKVQTLSEDTTNYGDSVSTNGDWFIIGAYGYQAIYIYAFDGTNWYLYTSFQKTSYINFGICISSYENVIVVGSEDNTVFIYRYDGANWNLEKTLPGPSYFGSSVSVYENVIIVGAAAYDSNQAFIYRYDGTNWNLEKTLTGDSFSYFGDSVSIYDNFTVIGSFDSKAFVYEETLILQINILNCSSLFSSFECYWEGIQSSFTLKYQINYGIDWIDIQNPIIEDENIYYQQFNSSIYDNITGNEYYSIQIRVCDLESSICGESSSSINLITKIDSVKDFQLLNPLNYSINIIWIPPNVQIDEGIAHLNHYNISYFIQSEPDSIYSILVDNSSTSYLLDDLECENDYEISICGCRTFECEEDDKGEIIESSISKQFETISNLTCSISYSIDINCNWNQSINCSIPFYYNFTYQSISQNDSGNYQSYSLNQQFTAQFPNQEYQINVSACNSNGKCGYISSISITTDNLPISPIIYDSIPKIEEIELNFTKLNNANNYSISLDNETNWQKFTSLDLSGNEVIGTISEISGNIEYNISIRGCSDLNCETSYLGESSSIISTKAKLGNISSLSCKSFMLGFYCNWDSLELSSGLKAYSFNYNSTSICLTNLTRNYSISTGLKSGEYYEISIYSSSNSNCSINEYSGINSTTSIIPLSMQCDIYQTSENSTNTTAITIGIIIPILIILMIIIGIIFIKKRKKNKVIQEIIKEKELHTDLDI